MEINLKRYPLIYVLDDDSLYLNIISKIIKNSTTYEYKCFDKSKDMLDEIESKTYEELPDLFLLDVVMPDLNGFELCNILKTSKNTSQIPVVFLSGISNEEDILAGFEVGGLDYIKKPFLKREFLARINNSIKLKLLEDDLRRNKKKHLSIVEDFSIANSISKIEVIFKGIYNYLETKEIFINYSFLQMELIGEISGNISEYLGMNSEFVEKIRFYSKYRDIGNIFINKELFFKCDSFNDDDYREIQNHVVYGSKMFKEYEVDSMFKNIVFYHHEQWDGNGYLAGVDGENIPIEARITAIADGFCTMISDRPFRKKNSLQYAFANLLSERGKKYDPDIINKIIKKKKEITYTVEKSHIIKETLF